MGRIETEKAEIAKEREQYACLEELERWTMEEQKRLGEKRETLSQLLEQTRKEVDALNLQNAPVSFHHSKNASESYFDSAYYQRTNHL